MAAGKGLVLCYLPENAAWEQKLRPALTIAGARMKQIAPGDAGEYVGFLAGLRGFAKREDAEEIAAPGQAVLVLCGFAGAGLEAVLRSLQKAGVPRSVYKAVVTAENAKWTFAGLCDELRREREAIENGEGGAQG